MQHRLNNDSHAFVQALHLRTPGVPIGDVRIGCARVAQPLAWDTPACRLTIDGDSAGLVFHRPDNWARFGIDIVPAVDGAPAVAPLGRIETLPEPHADDIRRMLLAQKAYVEGGLALTLYCARLVDEEKTASEENARSNATLLLDILTPIAKSWPSQWC